MKYSKLIEMPAIELNLEKQNISSIKLDRNMNKTAIVEIAGKDSVASSLIALQAFSQLRHPTQSVVSTSTP